MTKVNLGSILFEQKETVKTANGNGLDLIGVSNEIGLHVSRAKRISDLSRYKFIQKEWFAYNPMRVNVGSIGYVYKQDQVGIVSPDYVVFSCSEEILPGYLLYLLKSDEGIEAINKNASGAVRKRLYFADLAKIEILLPSIESQRDRLNAFKKIHNLGNKISEHRSKNSLLSQLKQAILQEAIQGKLTRAWRTQKPERITGKNSAAALLERIKTEKAQLVKEKKFKKEKRLPPIEKEEIPFELPEGWVWCRLGEIGLINPKTVASDELEASFVPMSLISENFGVEPTGEIKKWGEIKKGYTHFAENDIAVAKITPCFENSKAAVFKNLMNGIGAGTTELHIFRNLPSAPLESYFIYTLFKSSDFLKTGESLMTGTAGQKRVPKEYIQNYLMALPPKEEQKAIVAKVEALMEKCHALEQQFLQSEAHAQMLMQAVLKEAFEIKKENILEPIE